jgi:hypothetical protein
MAALPEFSKLRDGFPAKGAPEVKALIGGKVNADWITNACAIRVSRALNKAGHRIPYIKSDKGAETVSGADAQWYIFRVVQLRKHMIGKYGQPSIAITRSGSGPISMGSFAGKSGIIEFEVAFSDATGHFDLWDGSRCLYEGYFDKAKSVSLWKAG